MVQKPKAVKYKVIGGYILLFVTAVVSVWFVYTEISKIAAPDTGNSDNRKILKISNTLASLYASESLARNSILTADPADFDKYTQALDSVNREIEAIKSEAEPAQVQKFDTVQMLLERKKNSVQEIINYRKEYNRKNTFRSAISSIYNAKDSVRGTLKPVPVSRRYQWENLANSLLTQQQLDSIRKLQMSNDSLAIVFDKVLRRLIRRDDLLQYQLLQKEQKLLDESRVISDQLRVILSSVENDFLQNSYDQIKESRNALAKTADTMAWVGAASFLILLALAWIIIRDLTSNQNYRRQLEVLNKENENLLRSKSMLMATVTHDIRTPLGSIIGFYDLLKESEMPPRQKQYLSNIKESADFILRLVNDLLDFSKLENNSISIEKVSFNMKNAIEATCRVLEPIAINKNIELNWDIDEELNRNFISDPYRIKQVITNLVGNAVKFTQEGSVEVTGRLENGFINISVIDTGIGIAKEKQDEVFKEFTQAHSGIEKKFGGTGLGLTISKRITELLGGTIHLESEEGKGSLFAIMIPCVPCETGNTAAETEITEDITKYLEGKKILITDDDAMQLTLMQELFSQYPVTVVTEINAAEVIAHLEQEHYDLLLTDIQMPQMNGFDLVKLVRQHVNRTIATMPVIALSGKRDLTESDFTGKGFTASHPKPVQLETLLALISNIFGNKAIPAAKKQLRHHDNSTPLYNLKSLRQFTGDDNESLKAILETFSDSAKENIETLKKAAADNNRQSLGETAHKMIPMLRQMEANAIAGLLIPIEDNAQEMPIGQIETLIQKAEIKINELLAMLQEEVA